MKIDARTRAKSDKDSAESIVASANAKIDARTRAKSDKGGEVYMANEGSASVMMSFSLPTSGKYLRCKETKIRIESVR